MKKEKQGNFDLFASILALVLGILFLVTIFDQINLAFEWATHSRTSGQLVPLTEKEDFFICQNLKCGFTHKLQFSNDFEYLERPSFAYWEDVTVFYRESLGVKKVTDYSHFFPYYPLFDFLSLGFLTFVYLRFKRIKKLEKKSDVDKRTEKFDSEMENDSAPLPSFGVSFLLGTLHIVASILLGFSLTFLDIDREYQILLSIVLVLVLTYLAFNLFSKNLTLVLTGFLSIFASFQGPSLHYFFDIQSDLKHSDKQLFETLDNGKIDLEFMGFDSFSSGGSKGKRSYTYRWASPYIRVGEEGNKNWMFWVKIEQDWIKNPKFREAFFQEWSKNRKAVLIQEDDQLINAIANSERRFALDLKQGVYPYKLILSFEDEIQSAKTKLLWTFGIIFGIWFLLAAFRFYAGSLPDPKSSSPS